MTNTIRLVPNSTGTNCSRAFEKSQVKSQGSAPRPRELARRRTRKGTVVPLDPIELRLVDGRTMQVDATVRRWLPIVHSARHSVDRRCGEATGKSRAHPRSTHVLRHGSRGPCACRGRFPPPQHRACDRPRGCCRPAELPRLPPPRIAGIIMSDGSSEPFPHEGQKRGRDPCVARRCARSGSAPTLPTPALSSARRRASAWRRLPPRCPSVRPRCRSSVAGWQRPRSASSDFVRAGA